MPRPKLYRLKWLLKRYCRYCRLTLTSDEEQLMAQKAVVQQLMWMKAGAMVLQMLLKAVQRALKADD